MTQLSGRIVAGIGFASAATAQELIDLIDACLAEAGLAATHLAAIVTHKRKLGTALPLHVAAHFGVLSVPEGVPLGLHASADAAARFDDGDPRADLRQCPRGGESGPPPSGAQTPVPVERRPCRPPACLRSPSRGRCRARAPKSGGGRP